MGYKLVRNGQRQWCLDHGVSGTWRTSSDPVASRRAKIFEEGGEVVKEGDPAELYDLLDVVLALVDQVDPAGIWARRHVLKVQQLGTFSEFIEWSPVPPQPDRDGL